MRTAPAANIRVISHHVVKHFLVFREQRTYKLHRGSLGELLWILAENYTEIFGWLLKWQWINTDHVSTIPPLHINSL